jgi:hypothetical protein
VKQKPEDSIRIFSAGLLLNQIDILMAEIDGVRAAKDIEAVHKTRFLLAEYGRYWMYFTIVCQPSGAVFGCKMFAG